MEKLQFLEGNWTTTTKTSSDLFESEFRGQITGRWGPQKAWFTSDFIADPSSKVKYAVHVLIYFDSANEHYTAVAINTFSRIGKIYQGKWLDATTLRFTDEKGQQRVSYKDLPDGKVSFFVEQLGDDNTFHKYSEAIWNPLPSE